MKEHGFDFFCKLENVFRIF
eukprot:UN18071